MFVRKTAGQGHIGPELRNFSHHTRQFAQYLAAPLRGGREGAPTPTHPTARHGVVEHAHCDTHALPIGSGYRVSPTTWFHFLVTQRPIAGANYWPTAHFLIKHEDLPRHLLKTATELAREAVKSRAGESREELFTLVISGGTAVELLAKHVLAEISLALLVDRGDMNGILHAAGRADLAKAGPMQFKTVTVTDCLATIGKIYSKFNWSGSNDAAHTVLQARNAAIHLGLVDRYNLHAVVRALVQTIDRLLSLGESDRELFWSRELLPIIKAVLDENAEEIRSVVEAKKLRADQKYKALLEQLQGTDAVSLLVALQERGLQFQADLEERFECPVCSHRGWLAYDIERGNPLYVPGSGYDDGPLYEVTQTAYPIVFYCSVCELELDVEEIEAEGDDMAAVIELDPDVADDREASMLDFDPY